MTSLGILTPGNIKIKSRMKTTITRMECGWWNMVRRPREKEDCWWEQGV